MDIILVGSGNTATVIGRKSLSAGQRILQVYSRKYAHADDLARRLGARSVSSIPFIERNADIMIVAMRDDAINSFTQALGQTKSLIAHTAGALSINEVRGFNESYGVIYPLQSLRKDIEIIPPLTILVDGNNIVTREKLKEFAKTIAENTLEADDHMRLKYHLAGTLVNNFTNYLFSLAATFCEKENISFAVLQPLMEETVMRLRNISPEATQTGPALRNDLITLQNHRLLIKKYPEILKFYDLFTEEIQKSDLNFKA